MPGIDFGFCPGHLGCADREVAQDHVVHRRFEGAQAVVVGAGKVEVDPKRAIGGKLRAGEKRAAEFLIDETVEDVRERVELAHELPERRIDAEEHRPRELGCALEFVPDAFGRRRKPDDLDLAFRPGEPAAVGKLAAAAGKERRVGDKDGAWPRIEDLGLDDERLGLVLAQIARQGSGPPVRN